MATVKTKKTGLVVLGALLTLSVFPLSAQDRPIRQGSIEIILGSYDMNEPRFDAVYPKGGLLAGLGASAAIVSNLNIYLEAKYWQREGALTFSKEKTTLRLVPLSLGARYIVPLGVVNPYVGAGGDVYFYYEDNPIGTTTNSAVGCHVMGGTCIRFAKSVPLMINLKVKYTWAKTTQSDLQIQLGGLEYAAGIGFAF
jgi:hypothetical protein